MPPRGRPQGHEKVGRRMIRETDWSRVDFNPDQYRVVEMDDENDDPLIIIDSRGHRSDRLRFADEGSGSFYTENDFDDDDYSEEVEEDLCGSGDPHANLLNSAKSKIRQAEQYQQTHVTLTLEELSVLNSTSTKHSTPTEIRRPKTRQPRSRKPVGASPATTVSSPLPSSPEIRGSASNSVERLRKRKVASRAFSAPQAATSSDKTASFAPSQAVLAWTRPRK
jgi:hypothetical protein